MRAWYAQFAERYRAGFKHNSVQFNNEETQSKTMITKLGQEMTIMLVKRMLQLTPQACEELKKVDHYNFNIFTLRNTTDGNELITILPYILARQGFFAKCNLEFSNLINFVRHLSAGYK